MSHLILLACLACFVWFLRRDKARRDGVSAAIWIPTLWVGILASRPLSAWLGLGGVRTDIESATAGSPIDMLGYLVLITAAAVVLARRHLNWGEVLSCSWPLFLFYGYLLLSVVWANYPLVSFKRWFKEFGNILVVLVVLTERRPQEAFKAVFVRCAYLLIPLSIVFIRYFPDLGRHYNIHSGELQAVGVTFQKNSLGAMVLVCGVIVLWDLIALWRRRREETGSRLKPDRVALVSLLVMGAYLLYLCDSKTSMVGLALAGGIMATARLPVIQKRLGLLGMLGVLAAVALLLLNEMFDFQRMILEGLGRDMTLTGRTDVWKAVLSVGTDPLLGTGFCSFWDDLTIQSKLPYWVVFSAHNGYIEVYLAGGMMGVALLGFWLLMTGIQINRALSWGGDYAVACFAVFVVVLIANFTESNFAVMSPLGFLFLLTSLGSAPRYVLSREPKSSPLAAQAMQY